MQLNIVQVIDDALCHRLSLLLIDVVEHGASVGFLAPLAYGKAAAYWRDVGLELQRHTILILANEGSAVLGAVQLVLCTKDNGQHRAEVQKLMVHSAQRGFGISSQLMHAAEIAARAAQRDLLVLDTQVGSAAESIYQHWGWHKAGEVPAYASDSRGRLHGTAYYYKSLY